MTAQRDDCKGMGARRKQNPAAHPAGRRAGAAGTRTHAHTPTPRGPAPDPSRAPKPPRGPCWAAPLTRNWSMVSARRERRAAAARRAGPSLPLPERGAEPAVGFRVTPGPARASRLASPRPASPASPSRRPGAPWRSAPALPPELASWCQGGGGASPKSQAWPDSFGHSHSTAPVPKSRFWKPGLGLGIYITTCIPTILMHSQA